MSFKFKVQSSKFKVFGEFDLVNLTGEFTFSRIPRRALLITFFTMLTICSTVLTAQAQKRDNLTNEEDLVIREAQDLDLRMKVLVQVVKRRLLALSDSKAAESKQAKKDAETWGELRTGTQAELFYDIQRTLDEAIAKIDDVAERDLKNPLFSKAVHILSDGCKDFIPQFKSFEEKAADPKVRGLILNSIDSCSQIIEASGKVQKEEKKKKN